VPNFIFGIIFIFIGSIMGIYSIYEMRVKNKIILPVSLIVFVHFFIILGIFLITRNIGLGFVAMIFYNIVFVAELIIYILKNKDVNLKIEQLVNEVNDELKFWQSVIYENHKFVDDYECFEHLMRVDKIVKKAINMDLFEIVKPLLNFLEEHKNYFKSYKVSEIAKKLKISEDNWWFYLDDK
jgi:hypothetical protein